MFNQFISRKLSTTENTANRESWQRHYGVSQKRTGAILYGFDFWDSQGSASIMTYRPICSRGDNVLNSNDNNNEWMLFAQRE